MKKMCFWMCAVFGISLLLAACGKSNSSLVLLPPGTISGTVSGYAGTDMVIQNNGADDLVISGGSTTFAFTKKVPFGGKYDVTVKSQPTTTAPHQLCSVTNGSGTVKGSSVTSVVVTCTTYTWETLADIGSYTPAFSDFTPAGKSVLYTANSDTQQVFSFPTSSNTLGVFSAITPTTALTDTYLGLGWVGNNLFVAENNSMLVYNTVSDTWSSATNSLDNGYYDAQTTADDSGFVYSLTTDTNVLLKFNTANSTFVSIPTPTDIITGGSEPRATWDSTMQRVYLGDYSGNSFYAFNPANSSFTKLTAFPDVSGMSDAFCSDRRGHLFTANSDCSTTTAVWMYTAATNTWSPFVSLPFAHGCEASCSVSADGWLFFGDGDLYNFARIKIF